MELNDYLIILAHKLKENMSKGNKEEVIRLVKLLSEICIEKIRELENG